MASSPMAFISYRRSDAAPAAQGLYVQLRSRLGLGRSFMDVSGTRVGDVWPDRLRRALEDATVLLVVVGPSWLTAADRYGRRRLDQTNDWVRNEILYALKARTPILPLLVGEGTELPPAEGLPEDVQPLLDFTVLRLRDERWDADFDELVNTLVKSHGFVANDRRVILPQPQVKIDALSDTDIEKQLTSLPGWEPIESIVPGDYPNARHELRKAYRFHAFATAIEFMRSAVDLVEKLQHHPRWENQWRTVTVYLSTWDIGNKITALDIELAKAFDALYDQMRGK
jgi:pterin-4a-carbinolamine dehydratase